MQTVMFIVLSAVTLISGALVVTTRSLFRAALWLVLTFFGIAGLFLLLHAEFLAVAQVLIYVGAISTLIIFAIMLSRGVMDPGARRFNEQWGLVAGFSAVFFVLLAAILTRVQWLQNAADAPVRMSSRSCALTTARSSLLQNSLPWSWTMRGLAPLHLLSAASNSMATARPVSSRRSLW